MSYARWSNRPGTRPAWPAIVRHEMLRAWDDQWGRLAAIGVAGYTVLFLGSVYAFNSADQSAHTLENFLQFAGNLRWGVLAMAAVMAGPALLEDTRSGALELYFARPVSQRTYLLAKSGAVLLMTFLLTLVPLLLYGLATVLLFQEHPEGWAWMPLRSLGQSLLWVVPLAGAGLGLSCLSRSGRAAAVSLFAGVFVLEIIVTQLLSSITDDARLAVVSPLAAHAAQNEWLWTTPAGDFPAWWGLVALLGVAVVGWTLVIMRHPRLEGQA